MYQTVLSSGSGKNFTDVDGKQLVAIGNVTHKAGDAVWTDGKCIYGWVRTNQSNFLPEFGIEGVPFLDVAKGYPPTVAGVIASLQNPAKAKKLCTLGAYAANNTFPILVDGEKHSFLILVSGRKAINLSTGEEWTFPLGGTDDNQYNINILDSMATDDGDLLTLSTYPRLDGSEGYTLTVYKNGNILRTYSPDGGAHAEAGKTVGLIPECVRLRQDGSFSGTFTEAAIYADSSSETTSVTGTPEGTVVFFLFEPIEGVDNPQVQSGDITTLEFQVSEKETIIPFQDAVIAHSSTHSTSSGSLFFYDSRNGRKEAIFTTTHSETDEQDFADLYIDDVGLTPLWDYENGMRVTAMAGGYTAIRLSEKGFDARCNYSFPAPTRTESNTQSGTPYTLDAGGAPVQCHAPVLQNGGHVGAVSWVSTLPAGYSGEASCLGFTFDVSQNKVFDVSQTDDGKYLILAASGLYLSDGANASKVQDGFKAVGVHSDGVSRSLSNLRIRKPKCLVPIRARLKNNYT